MEDHMSDTQDTSAPTCEKCGATVTVATGLPVFVSFNDEGTVATVGTDVSEIACDLTDDSFSCSTEGCDTSVSSATHDGIVRRLEVIAKTAAPSLDVEVA
jgi:hypothetical protein